MVVVCQFKPLSPLHLGCFPKPLKTGEVVYFVKNGKDPKHPSSYRPICLLPTIGKLLEKLINQRLNYYLETNRKLDEKQYGFRPGRSCEQAIQQVIENVKDFQQTGEEVALISIDIKAAFDTIQWEDVINSLKKLACPPYLTTAIKSYLEERNVLINRGTGNEVVPVHKGCPQGSCLGPTLWLLIANHLLEGFPTSNVMKINAFADDLILVVKAKHRRQLEQHCELAIKPVAEWAKKYTLDLSEEKKQMMVMNRKGRLLKRLPSVKIKNVNIKNVNRIKYLGIIISSNLRG